MRNVYLDVKGEKKLINVVLEMFGQMLNHFVSFVH